MAVCSTTITPNQIIWPEDKKAEAEQEKPIAQKQFNATWTPDKGLKIAKPIPAVFAKAQKDWNGFKSFLKEVEAYGRTLTGSQLKVYMAKERKLRGGK